jgi:hypothetical protein
MKTAETFAAACAVESKDSNVAYSGWTSGVDRARDKDHH